MAIQTLGITQVKMEVAQKYARQHDAADVFINTLIPLYWETAPHYDLPAENVMMQSWKETGRGHFPGVVPVSFNNPAGIKTKSGGDNSDPEAHTKFNSWKAGVQAHCSHLAKYGGKSESEMRADHERSPRLQFVTRGSAPNLEDLGGKYAPSLSYGVDLANMVQGLLDFAKANDGIIGDAPMALTDRIKERIAARGVEVHDIRGEMTQHEDDRYERLPNEAWIYTAVHYTAVPRGVRSLSGDIGSWRGHSQYHVGHHGWPGIAYFIGISQSGRVFILRDVEEMGYHGFTANSNTLAICGDFGPDDTPTDQLLKSTEEVLKTLHHDTPELPKLIGHAGTYGHDELDFIDSRNDTNCPGSLLPFVREYRAGKYEEQRPSEALYIPGNQAGDIPIVLGFRGLFERLGAAKYPDDPIAGGLSIFGYPKSSEESTDYGSRQVFERAVLRWERDSNPPFDLVIEHLSQQ